MKERRIIRIGRGGGAYFSFTTRTNDYNKEPDLSLEQWRFLSGFYGGNRGYVIKLGAESIAEVSLDDVPKEFLAQDPKTLGQETREPAEAGGLYAVRSIRWDESDLLAALQVLERDENGLTFAWKVLKHFEKPVRN